MKKLALIIISAFLLSYAFGQTTMSNEELIIDASKQFETLKTQMDEHEKHKPVGKKEDLLKQIDARNILISTLSAKNPNDLTEDLKNLLITYKNENDSLQDIVQKIVDWEKTRNDYEFKLREVTVTINLLQQFIDKNQTDNITKKAIEDAQLEHEKLREKQAGQFIGSIYTLRTMLDILGGVYSTGSSIIILDKETNKKISKILRNSGMTILSILGGVLALNSYQKDKKGEAGVYLGVSIGFTALGELLKNSKKTVYALEASMRNILFGDVIRKHEHVVERMKTNVDKLYNKVIPVGAGNTNWFPEEADYLLFEEIIKDRDELQLFIYDIRQQAELILKNNLNQSDVSRQLLQKMIIDANSLEGRWIQDRSLFNQNIAFIKTELIQNKKK